MPKLHVERQHMNYSNDTISVTLRISFNFKGVMSDIGKYLFCQYPNCCCVDMQLGYQFLI